MVFSLETVGGCRGQRTRREENRNRRHWQAFNAQKFPRGVPIAEHSPDMSWYGKNDSWSWPGSDWGSEYGSESYGPGGKHGKSGKKGSGGKSSGYCGGKGLENS